jgi:hypothetical protein
MAIAVHASASAAASGHASSWSVANAATPPTQAAAIQASFMSCRSLRRPVARFPQPCVSFEGSIVQDAAAGV